MPEGRLQVTCSRGVKLVADKAIQACAAEEWDLVVCPGGLPGADHLRDCPTLTEMLKKQAGASKLYGAICAAPAVVLQTHGLLAGKRATCYPADRFTGEYATRSRRSLCFLSALCLSFVVRDVWTEGGTEGGGFIDIDDIIPPPFLQARWRSTRGRRRWSLSTGTPSHLG